MLLITSICIIVCDLKEIGDYACGNPVHNFYFYRIGLRTISLTYEGMTFKFFREIIYQLIKVDWEEIGCVPVLHAFEN